MAGHDTSLMSQRSIRELVYPGLQPTSQPAQIRKERRRCCRFHRRLPGELIVSQNEYRITCMDIGYGGVCLIAPDHVQVTPGDLVRVRITLGSQLFEDQFSVVKCEADGDESILHLKL